MTETATIGMGGALNSGTSVEWWTPPHVFEALGLEFDVDPCAPPLPAAPWIPAQVRHSFRPGFPGGLDVPWMGRVWLNPPYGRECANWVARLVDHAQSEYSTDEGIALVFTRTDARWAQAAMEAADAVCFIAGRLRFIDGTETDRARRGHNAANGSMLLAYGPECAAAVLSCGLGVSFTQQQPHKTTRPPQGEKR